MNNVKKSIGWCNWTINPVKGLCPVGCSYCYARRAYGRNCNATFKDKSIRYTPEVFQDGSMYKTKPGDRIFVGSTIDLFHPLCSMWNDLIFNFCKAWSDRTFIFLTKCPENLPKEFPDNCWVGGSATGAEMFYDACWHLSSVKAKVKLISFEPLQERINGGECVDGYRLDLLKEAGINWLIIGQQTPVNQSTMPCIEWIKEIVDAADKAKIPVFLKNNLDKLFVNEARKQVAQGILPESVIPIWAGNKERYLKNLRQEFPVIATEKEGK